MTSPSSHPIGYGQCIAALEYMAQAVHAGDLSALQMGAFVWAQRGNEIIEGTETWADQMLPPIIFGGGTVTAPLRVRSALSELPPPRVDDPYLTRVEDYEDTLEIMRFSARRTLAEAGIEFIEDDSFVYPDFQPDFMLED